MLSNLPGLEPIEPPLLAAVQSTHGTAYVPRARNYQGFLVQRRYRGIGTPRRWQDAVQSGKLGGQVWEEYARFVPYQRVFLNPAAVEAAGLNYAEVSTQVEACGEAVFTHPTYAPLCLHWGQNAHGYLVSPVDSTIPDSDQTPICFTVRTSQFTREHIYHLEWPAEEGPLLSDLQQMGGLALHLWRDEESWRGYSTRNLAAAQRVVTTHGHTWAWAQRYSVYEVTVESLSQPMQRWRFATAEEARTWYERLPLGPRQDTAAYEEDHLLATLTNAERLLDTEFNGHIIETKYLPSDWQAKPFLLSPHQVAAVVANGIPKADLTTSDTPLCEPVPTLASILDEQKLSTTEVAARLGLTLPTLQRRLHNPSQWTVGELQRAAQLTNWPLSSIIQLLDV